jgi:hypothetical protein
MNFPEVGLMDVMVGKYPKKFFQKCLLEKSNPKYEKLAQTLFFEGGKIPFNKSLPDEHITKGVRVLKSIIDSFDCKHEHKIHVCGIILAELCEEK